MTRATPGKAVAIVLVAAFLFVMTSLSLEVRHLRAGAPSIIPTSPIYFVGFFQYDSNTGSRITLFRDRHIAWCVGLGSKRRRSS